MYMNMNYVHKLAKHMCINRVYVKARYVFSFLVLLVFLLINGVVQHLPNYTSGFYEPKRLKSIDGDASH